MAIMAPNNDANQRTEKNGEEGKEVEGVETEAAAGGRKL